MERFLAYLEREGITGWPRLESGKLNMKRKTFKDMSKAYPQLEGAAATSLRTRQNAHSEACGRRRRPESNGALAIQSQDVTHTAESLSMDLLAGGVAAIS